MQVLDMIRLSSEGYCIEAHRVGANTSALKYFIESCVQRFPLCIFVTLYLR